MVVKQFSRRVAVEALRRIGYVIWVKRGLANFRIVVDFKRQTHKLFGCYMVKPHGQLVWVSSTPHSAYTPHLSTS